MIELIEVDGLLFTLNINKVGNNRFIVNLDRKSENSKNTNLIKLLNQIEEMISLFIRNNNPKLIAFFFTNFDNESKWFRICEWKIRKSLKKEWKIRVENSALILEIS
jgi:hypothetical protein